MFLVRLLRIFKINFIDKLDLGSIPRSRVCKEI